MAELRTLTYSVKMHIDGADKPARAFRMTLNSMEQGAGKAEAEVNKLAQTIGAKYKAKIVAAVDDTKSAANALKQAGKESNRTNKAFNQLSQEYAHLTARTGKSALAQEKMNALHRLGANATLSQKKAIVKLVNAQAAQVAATNKAQGSFRGLRGQAQNLGWQFQDVAVQAQMGTSALVILGQQGSQLASGFGPMGALVGAGIAIGAAALGVFSTSMKDSKKDAKDLKDSVQSLSESMTDLMGAGFESTEAFQSKTIEEVNVEIKKLEKNNKAVIKTMTEAAVVYSKFNDKNKAGATEVGTFNDAMEEGQYVQAKNNAQIKRLLELKRLQSIANGRTIEETIADEKTNKSLVKTLGKKAREINMNQRMIDLESAALRGANGEQLNAIALAHDAIDKHEAEEQAIKDKTEAVKKATAEQAKADKAFEKMLAVGAKYDPNIKLSLLQRQYAEERAMFAGNQEVLSQMEDHYTDERLKINGTFWQKYGVAAKENLENFDQIAKVSLENFTTGFGDSIGNAIVYSEDFGDAMSNMFKCMAVNAISFYAQLMLQQAVAWAFGETGNTAAQLSAANTMTMNAQAMSSMAAVNAFASTAAIPIVGPILAPAASAAAFAATQPMAAAVSGFAYAGAMDKGGVIPSGSSAVVSEYGNELVNGTMIYNGSQSSMQVTGREQTAKKSGGNSSSNNITINSNGNATPEAIARAVARAIKKGSKVLDTAVFDSMNRGSKNRGKSFA